MEQTETKTLTPRKIFTVLIHNKEYDVYDIDGKQHEGYNDSPKTWWLYFSGRLPEGLVPPADSESFTPYRNSINRRLWDIRIKQINTSKEKWGDTNFSNHTNVEMWCNDKLVYSFGSTGNASGFAFAMAKVQYMQVSLSEHPFNFFESEKENGRKICWYGLPATIKVSSVHSWEIKIIPDYTAGLDKEQWWKEYKNRASKITAKDEMDLDEDKMDDEYMVEEMNDDCINWGDAYSDQNIYWFRK